MMKWRKTEYRGVSGSLAGAITACITVALVGCNSATEPNDYTHSTFDNKELLAPAHQIGEFHNDVILAYEARRPDGNVTWQSFVPTVTAAANDALSARGIDATIHVGDTELILQHMLALKERGVIDFMAPTIDGLVRFMDHLAQTGEVDARETAAIKAFLLDMYADAKRSGPTTPLRVPEFRAGADTPALRAFIDVYEASASVWPNVHLTPDDRGTYDKARRVVSTGVDASTQLFMRKFIGSFLGGIAGGTMSILAEEVLNNLNEFGDTPPTCSTCPACATGDCF